LTRDPTSADSVSLVTLAVITTFCVTTQLFAVVITCRAFVLVWREKLEIKFQSNSRNKQWDNRY